MARVWRDGQKREVFVYRFITTGTIEEKIFQRQIVKQSMASHIIDAEITSPDFDQQELKDIFCFTENVKSETYSLLSSSERNSDKQRTIEVLNKKD